MPKKGTRLAALLGVIAFAAAGAAEDMPWRPGQVRAIRRP